MVLVLDTSGSMAGVKMEQAQKALKYCLGATQARRPLRASSTSPPPSSRTATSSSPANKDYLDAATKWVDELEATGGTAIRPALDDALGNADRTTRAGRSPSSSSPTASRPSARPNPDKILKNDRREEHARNTRIFTFGVGDDVNAAMLDQLADATRAVSTYVRPAEDIEAKVASLYGKISNPVLTNLKLAVGDDDPHPRDLPAAAAGPVPRQPARRARPLHRAAGTRPSS